MGDDGPIPTLLHRAALAVVFYVDIAALDASVEAGAQREAALAVWAAITDASDDEQAMIMARMFARPREPPPDPTLNPDYDQT